MLRSETYIGKHHAKVSSARGEETITREVPPIVTEGLFERVRRACERNRRTRVARDGSGAAEGLRRYLLSGLIRCGVCGSSCTANSVKDRHDPEKRYTYYACSDGRNGAWSRRGPEKHAQYVSAEWLENEVWSDIRSFIEDPGEYLSKIREQMAGEAEGEHAELVRLRDDYAKRLAAKQAERSRYAEIAARNPDLPAEAIDAHLADLRTQTDNLAMLLENAEERLAQHAARIEIADATAEWLTGLRGRLQDVEGHSEEAFLARRQLVQLFVEGFVIGGKGEKVRITYRLHDPQEKRGGSGLCRVSRNSNEFLKMKQKRDVSLTVTR
jgi:site-specific DNA recombinase